MNLDIVKIDKNLSEELEADKYGNLAAKLSNLTLNRISILPSLAIPNPICREMTKEFEGNRVIDLINEFKKDQFQENKDVPFLDIVISSSIKLTADIRLSGIGINAKNLKVLESKIGYPLVLQLMKAYAAGILYLIHASELPPPPAVDMESFISKAIKNKSLLLNNEDREFVSNLFKAKSAEALKGLLGNKAKKTSIAHRFFGVDALEEIIKLSVTYIEEKDIFASMIFQPMLLVDNDGDSFRGEMLTNDPLTGEATLQMIPIKNGKAKKSSEPKKETMDKLEKIASKIRLSHREIKRVFFLKKSDHLYLTNIEDEISVSPQADLAHKLYLMEQGSIDLEYIISHINSKTIQNLLHPIIDKDHAQQFEVLKGGIHGSFGAARGKVYFNANSLLAAYEECTRKGSKEKDFILAMPATYSGEVKAIKVARGVLSAEGGFSSHAPVVARSMNKVALVNNDIKFGENFFSFQGKKIKEGDEITLNVEMGNKPEIYLGKVDLLKPDFEKNNLYHLVSLLAGLQDSVKVMVNADQPEEAEMGLRFKAQGLGLCRTEHMFFNPERLSIFVRMLMAQDRKKMDFLLGDLERFQEKDFREIFRLYQDKPVTVRLLDAPLHEFIPKTEEEFKRIHLSMQEQGDNIDIDLLKMRCEQFREINPMLGHRGCRLGITRPEIYNMQVRAIMNAACSLIKKGISVKPKVMVPIVMHINEIKLVRNGKMIEGEHILGIVDIIEERLEAHGCQGKLKVDIGSMIEIPSAALVSHQLANYCDFFSYGTNDLTQTTCGLSRDDSTGFLSEYDKYDLIQGNPFRLLTNTVKEMITLSSARGRIRRPDIFLSVCGEHGGDPDNVNFFVEQGIHAISCSPFSIPLVWLALAKNKRVKSNGRRN